MRCGRRAATATALAGACALAALGSAGLVPMAARAATPSVPAVSFAATSTAPEVSLVSPGQAPRSPLRMTFTTGDTVKATIELRQSVQQSMGGREQRATVPTTAMQMHSTVGAVSGDGSAPVAFGYDGVTVADDGTFDSNQRSVYDAAIRGLTGVTGTSIVTPRNEVTQTSLSGTESLPDSMQQSLSRVSDQTGALSAPLPQQAVGVGAKWRVVTDTTVNGIHLHQESVYTLQERDGDHAVLTITGRQTASHQQAELPGVPAGTKTTIVSFASRMTGRTDLDLHSPLLANSGTMHLSSHQRFRVTTAGQHANVEQQLVVDTRLGRDLQG